LHTHVFSQFMVTPRLVLRSPTAGCGKTQMIDVLSKLTARPEKFDSITAAAIFRLIDESHPTLMIDEADNLGIALRPNGRLRAVINSGHRFGGQVAIMEGGEMRKFSTFAPLLLALPDAVHGLPRTLNSRCITLTMHRADGQRSCNALSPTAPMQCSMPHTPRSCFGGTTSTLIPIQRCRRARIIVWPTTGAH
ncbi:MAG: hypothetical protein WA453_01005, partial [Methyloceanibacter sp.]